MQYAVSSISFKGYKDAFPFSKLILNMGADVRRGAECCAEESYSLRSDSVPVAQDVAIKILQ